MQMAMLGQFLFESSTSVNLKEIRKETPLKDEF